MLSFWRQKYVHKTLTQKWVRYQRLEDTGNVRIFFFGEILADLFQTETQAGEAGVLIYFMYLLITLLVI